MTLLTEKGATRLMEECMTSIMRMGLLSARPARPRPAGRAPPALLRVACGSACCGVIHKIFRFPTNVFRFPTNVF
jgi:hypothetical protein